MTPRRGCAIVITASHNYTRGKGKMRNQTELKWVEFLDRAEALRLEWLENATDEQQKQDIEAGLENIRRLRAEAKES